MARIATADVVIGTRIRDDKGDIDGMAASLNRYGLLEPIVIAGEDNALICGERRLLAAQQLRWPEIDATVLWGVAPEKRFEMEREENEQRKALTVGESAKGFRASKALVEKAQEVRTRMVQASPDVISDRRKRAAPDADVAEALGVSRPQLAVAEQHVAAATRYPELKLPGITQEAAITVAKNLDKLPEPEREEKREALRRFDQPTLAELAEKPPMPSTPKPEPSAAAGWTKAAHQAWKLINSVRDAGGINALVKQWEPGNVAGFRAEIHQIAVTLAEWDAALMRSSTDAA